MTRHGISDNIGHKEGQLLLPKPLVMGNDWDRREPTGKGGMKLSWQEIAAQIKHVTFLIPPKYLLTFLKKCVNLIFVFIAINRRKPLVIKKTRFFTYFMTETDCLETFLNNKLSFFSQDNVFIKNRFSIFIRKLALITKHLLQFNLHRIEKKNLTWTTWIVGFLITLLFFLHLLIFQEIVLNC